MTTFYLFVIALCGGYIALSFIIGEVSDLLGGISDGIASLFESIGHAAEALTGAADAAEADIGQLDGAEHFGDGHGPSPFSLRTLCMFGVGFGAGGLLGKGLGLGDLASLLPAGGTGTVAGGVMYAFLRYVYRSVGTTSVTPIDYAGLVCRVSIPIPENGTGSVTVVVKGQMKNIPAVSSSGQALPARTEVAIVTLDGSTAIVEPLQPLDASAIPEHEAD